MSVTTVAPMPDPKERAHLRLCGIVTLETIVCFALPAVVLVMGAVYSPVVLLMPLGNPTELTLSAIACGCAASLLQGITIWMGDSPGGLEVLLPIVYVPLACTLHLVFLNRRALFR